MMDKIQAVQSSLPPFLVWCLFNHPSLLSWYVCLTVTSPLSPSSSYEHATSLTEVVPDISPLLRISPLHWQTWQQRPIDFWEHESETGHFLAYTDSCIWPIPIKWLKILISLKILKASEIIKRNKTQKCASLSSYPEQQIYNKIGKEIYICKTGI